MKRLPLVLIVLLTSLTPALVLATQPQWIITFQQGSLISDKQYYGVGWADYQGKDPNYECVTLSKDRALDDLAYQLSVSVKSQMEEKLSQKGKFSEEQVSSSLFVSTRKVLSGIKSQDKWTNPEDRRHWVLLTIDKQSAEQQVKQQDFINEVVDRLEKKQTEIADGVKKLNTLFMEHARRNELRLQEMEKLLNKINQKINPSGKEYNLLIQKIQSAEQHWQNQENQAKQQNTRMDQLMRQNQALTEQLGRILESIQKDQFLALVNDDVKQQQTHQQFKVTITPDKGRNADYIEGETIRFTVKANRDCYIKVIYLSTTGDNNSEIRTNTLLFPNPHVRDNRIKANTPTTIGSLDELVVEPPFGKDIITVVASVAQFEDIDELLKESREEFFSYETRSIQSAVNSRGVGVKKSAAVASDTCFIVSHAASPKKSDD